MKREINLALGLTDHGTHRRLWDVINAFGIKTVFLKATVGYHERGARGDKEICHKSGTRCGK